MNGVEILSSAEVACEFAFNWGLCWIVAGIIFGICLIIGMIIWIGTGDWKPILAMLGVGACLAFMFAPAAGDSNKVPTAYETHYKVTIDDSVSMNEFLDKYEILDQEGKIYTVKERE